MSLFYKLATLMGLVVVISNYLVQFPINYYGLEEILTYGAFSYPITFLITDLANRAYGKIVARKIVYIGFLIGVILTLFVFLQIFGPYIYKDSDWIWCSFFVAQNLDVKIFDLLRKKKLGLLLR